MRFICILQLFTALSPLLIGAWTSPRHKMNEVFDLDRVYYEQMPFRDQDFNSYADSARSERPKAALEQMADGSYRQDKILQKFLRDLSKQRGYKELGSKSFQNGVISDYKIEEQLRPQWFQKRATSEDRIEVRPKSLKEGVTLDDSIKEQLGLKMFPNPANSDDRKVKQYRQMFENQVTLNDRREKQHRLRVFSNQETSDERIKKQDRPKFSANQVSSKDQMKKQHRPKLLQNRATSKDRIEKQQQKLFENRATSEDRINEHLLQAAAKEVIRRIAKKLKHVRRAKKRRGPFGITGLRISRNAPEEAANLQTGPATACPEGQVRQGGVCSCPYLSSWNSEAEQCECVYGTYEDQHGYCRSFF